MQQGVIDHQNLETCIAMREIGSDVIDKFNLTKLKGDTVMNC